MTIKFNGRLYDKAITFLSKCLLIVSLVLEFSVINVNSGIEAIVFVFNNNTIYSKREVVDTSLSKLIN